MTQANEGISCRLLGPARDLMRVCGGIDGRVVVERGNLRWIGEDGKQIMLVFPTERDRDAFLADLAFGNGRQL